MTRIGQLISLSEARPKTTDRYWASAGYQFGNEYLYAIFRGEAEYDPRLVRIAMKLIDFELARKAVVASAQPGGNMKELIDAASKRLGGLDEARAKGIDALGSIFGGTSVSRR